MSVAVLSLMMIMRVARSRTVGAEAAGKPLQHSAARRTVGVRQLQPRRGVDGAHVHLPVELDQYRDLEGAGREVDVVGPVGELLSGDQVLRRHAGDGRHCRNRRIECVHVGASVVLGVMVTHAGGGERVRYGLSASTGPLRNLPDEATPGTVNDTIEPKPPPRWIPAFHFSGAGSSRE